MRAGGMATGRREEGGEDRCLTMSDISWPFEAFHTFCLAGVVQPFSVPCPSVTRCGTALLCHARLVP